MKRFFTTKKEGIILLELGVPIDTADCYYTSDGDNIAVLPEGVSYSEFYKSIKKDLADRLFPCWSAYALEYIDGVLDCALAKEEMNPNDYDGMTDYYIGHIKWFKECGVDMRILDKYTDTKQ